MRPLRFKTPGIGWTSVGKLYDVILTRDTWMHRADICRATDREMVLTADHDGRIIADIVADWARLHAQPFVLALTGPAGGSFGSGDTGDVGARLTLNAVEFARIVSGRAPGDGLLAQPGAMELDSPSDPEKSGGSVWESNPPGTATQPRNGFEDRGRHRPPSTPTANLQG